MWKRWILLPLPQNMIILLVTIPPTIRKQLDFFKGKINFKVFYTFSRAPTFPHRILICNALDA